MATNTILELSRVLADDKPSNANWKTSIKSGIVIEEGDQVLVKNAFIDTTSLSSANIVIDTQFTARVEFGFYLIGTGLEQTVLADRSYNLWGSETPTTIADGLPYFAIKTGSTGATGQYDETYTDFVEFNIPAGTYSKTYMAQYISRQMQTMANVANQRLKGVWSHGRQEGTDFPVIESVYQPCYITKVEGKYACSVGGPYEVPPYSPAYTDIFFRNALINLPNNVQYQHSTIFQNCGVDPGNANNADGGYIGCSNISMSYNADSQLYQWDYLHEPIVDNTSGNQVTGLLQQITPNEPSGRITQLNSRGGIYITNLEPIEFWRDTLGFTIDNITIDRNEVLAGQLDYDDFYRKTTQNFPAVAGLIDSGVTVNAGTYKIQSTRTIFSLDLEDFPLYKFNDSTTTVPLIATNPAKGTTISGGHFLLDIKGYNGNYKNAVMDYQYKGLVSSFFVSPDSYVCSVGPDSCVYIHHGSPMPVNVLEVTVINPLTHEPATNLGPNSSVYLQIVQMKQEPQ